MIPGIAMRKLSCAMLLGVVGCATAGAGGPPVDGQVLHAGVAAVDITPPVGYPMAGHFYERISTGVHDPLHVKALVLGQGPTRAALVICDVVNVPQELANRIRDEAQRRTGIPATNIA